MHKANRKMGISVQRITGADRFCFLVLLHLFCVPDAILLALFKDPVGSEILFWICRAWLIEILRIFKVVDKKILGIRGLRMRQKSQ